jgi:uncharacterized protein YdiU (UPF0061 family)
MSSSSNVSAASPNLADEQVNAPADNRQPDRAAAPDAKPLQAGPAGLAAAIEQTLPDSFAQLGPEFFTRLPAQPVPAPYLVGYARETGTLLGFEPEIATQASSAAAFAELFSGNASRAPDAGALPLPLPFATVYSGHQFGVWAGQLGDGRALTLGEVAHAGARYEVQLKGAGHTPYSRMGDGRAVLRSSIREFLCSEAMHHLGIPTTRALCVIGSDLPVRREEIETAAIVTRVAPSFVRFGHFEHFYANDRPDLLARLADHVIARFYPHCRASQDPYLALLEAVVRNTAELLAQWQAVGFCHGVMNTDNMSILGLTIDYGPFGFMDGFDTNHICNHSDTQGRYAYRVQPQAAYWNLFCLAQALLPLLGRPAGTDAAGADERALADAQRTLEGYKGIFAKAFEGCMRAKLGLETARDGDEVLIDRLFDIMNANHADFTLTFRNLARVSKHNAGGDAAVRDLFLDRAAFDAWAADYRLRLAAEAREDGPRAAAMNAVNPKYVLRNHLAEQAIRQARQKDFSEVARLLEILRQPFDEQPEAEAYAALPPDWASSLEVSCSS